MLKIVRRWPAGVVEGLTLVAVAAWVDVIGFSVAAGLFVSFMSGNTTTLGIAAGNANTSAVLASGGLIGTFLLGIVAGEWIGCRRRWLVFALESTMLWCAAWLLWQRSGEPYIIGCLALAMGMHNAGDQPGTKFAHRTYITGTLVSFGRAIGSALGGVGPWHDAVVPGMTWLIFVSSGIVSAILCVHVGRLPPLVLAAVVVLVFTAIAWRGQMRT